MTEAVLRERKRLSAVWIVPIVAVALGAWMVIHTYVMRGPEIAINFTSAEGVEVGKTKVRIRSVELGVVESVELTDKFDGVTIRARLDGEASPLLREDTLFWVVRPRLGPSGISGLGTLLSGAYIELSPGAGKKGRRSFKGLDDVPVTPPTAPGLHVVLTGEKASSLNPGNPVLYRGYTVGRVESAVLDPQTGHGRYDLFIEAPYDSLVSSSTRFWNSSGVSVDMGANGFSVKTESLEALIAGGVAFDLPAHGKPGRPVEPFSEFVLHPDYKSINLHPFEHHQDYVLLFDTSVRGLQPGAPVEYRGMRVGSVVGVSFDYVTEETQLGPDGHILVPVLIRLDPARINLPDTPAGREEFASIVDESVRAGLRATLKSGNLITGRLYINLDFFDDAPEATVHVRDGYHVLPTESSGLEQIEHKVSALLDKLQQLPLDDTLSSTRNALDGIAKTVATADQALQSLDGILGQDQAKQLPASLNATLAEVNETLGGLAPGSMLYEDLHGALNDLGMSLSGIEQLTRTLNNQPSALLFSSSKEPDPEPRVQ